MPAKKSPGNYFFLLRDKDHWLKLFAYEVPIHMIHADVFIITHKAVVLSELRYINLENQTKMFFFHILCIKTKCDLHKL